MLGVSEIFVTGGEPFLLADIGQILTACAAAAPTTVLTNGMLLVGRRLETLRALSRERVTLQISLDSPTPERHDHHRGAGTWARAWKGIERARAEGFRVRLAATVETEAEAEEIRQFLDGRHISEQDRVVRRIALRGFAVQGVALARADLVPEITITADGVYWHPVGAEDADLLVTQKSFRSPTRSLRHVAPLTAKTSIAIGWRRYSIVPNGRVPDRASSRGRFRDRTSKKPCRAEASRKHHSRRDAALPSGGGPRHPGRHDGRIVVAHRR